MQRGARFFRAGVRMLHVVLAASLTLGGVGAARAQGVPVEPNGSTIESPRRPGLARLRRCAPV